MKSLRTLTAGERRRITDGDPADLDVVELLARREWDRLEFTRRAGLLIVRPMNGSSRGGRRPMGSAGRRTRRRR